MRRREGRYLLLSNLSGQSPAQLWDKYLLLAQIEQAFKELKGDRAIRPVYHQSDARIEAHSFVCFLAYCLQVILKNMARGHATSLTPRAVIEQIAQMQMIDVHLSTTDRRTIVLSHYTQPNRDLALLLAKLGLEFPTQPPPRITADKAIAV